MDVVLRSDDSISGEDHAKLLYDLSSNRYFLWHDKGRNLTYVNGQMVDRQELHAYDKIQLGQTHLLFIPFCGEKFQWCVPA